MTDREKLIELLEGAESAVYWDSSDKGFVKKIADHLIANGVTFAKDTTVPSWIPVTERLPDKMGKYLCRYVFGENTEYPFEQVLWYYTAVEKPHFQNEGSMGLTVTHWMPLPEPPKEVE